MKSRFCTRCHYSGESEMNKKGSGWVEFMLYMFYIFPGIIYSVWRRSNKIETCPHCGGHELIPAKSPLAKRLFSE